MCFHSILWDIHNWFLSDYSQIPVAYILTTGVALKILELFLFVIFARFKQQNCLAYRLTITRMALATGIAILHNSVQ